MLWNIMLLLLQQSVGAFSGFTCFPYISSDCGVSLENYIYGYSASSSQSMLYTSR